ncbi:MAG: hypothetical protein K0R38_2450 [Polyangiaceae bacterium]|jgi:hypothetical protein|nr:hypothetical protein [Polyangiaceae bacterium]
MHATRLSAAACAALLGSSLVISCGDDEIIVQRGGNAGEGGDRGVVIPRGGEASGGGTTAGAAGAPPSEGGTRNLTGGSAGQPSAGQGGEAGAAPVPSLGEELSFCPRLTGLSKLSLAVEEAYIGVAIVDCRIAWVVPRRQDLIDMRNELITWNRRFWGCEGLPVTTFPLVWGTPALSQGDATIAMELYLAASKKELALSRVEYEEMEAALARLAKPLVQDPSTDPSKPSCNPSGGGGEGGVGGGGTGGGAGEATGGVGGSP